MTTDQQGPQAFGPPPPAYGSQAPAHASPPPPTHVPGPPPTHVPGPPPAYVPGQIPQPVPAGPEFVAFDKTNALVIDGEGVSFDLGGQITDHAWQHITQLHYTAQGTFLRVGITHTAGWFHECVINAKKQQKMIEWLTQLGPVAAYYQAQLANRG